MLLYLFCFMIIIEAFLNTEHNTYQQCYYNVSLRWRGEITITNYLMLSICLSVFIILFWDGRCINDILLRYQRRCTEKMNERTKEWTNSYRENSLFVCLFVWWCLSICLSVFIILFWDGRCINDILLSIYYLTCDQITLLISVMLSVQKGLNYYHKTEQI
jgi:hypothetical protein